MGKKAGFDLKNSDFPYLAAAIVVLIKRQWWEVLQLPSVSKLMDILGTDEQKELDSQFKNTSDTKGTANKQKYKTRDRVPSNPPEDPYILEPPSADFEPNMILVAKLALTLFKLWTNEGGYKTLTEEERGQLLAAKDEKLNKFYEKIIRVADAKAAAARTEELRQAAEGLAAIAEKGSNATSTPQDKTEGADQDLSKVEILKATKINSENLNRVQIATDKVMAEQEAVLDAAKNAKDSQGASAASVDLSDSSPPLQDISEDTPLTAVSVPLQEQPESTIELAPPPPAYQSSNTLPGGPVEEKKEKSSIPIQEIPVVKVADQSSLPSQSKPIDTRDDEASEPVQEAPALERDSNDGRPTSVIKGTMQSESVPAGGSTILSVHDGIVQAGGTDPIPSVTADKSRKTEADESTDSSKEDNKSTDAQEGGPNAAIKQFDESWESKISTEKSDDAIVKKREEDSSLRANTGSKIEALKDAIAAGKWERVKELAKELREDKSKAISTASADQKIQGFISEANMAVGKEDWGKVVKLSESIEEEDKFKGKIDDSGKPLRDLSNSELKKALKAKGIKGDELKGMTRMQLLKIITNQVDKGKPDEQEAMPSLPVDTSEISKELTDTLMELIKKEIQEQEKENTKKGASAGTGKVRGAANMLQSIIAGAVVMASSMMANAVGLTAQQVGNSVGLSDLLAQVQSGDTEDLKRISGLYINYLTEVINLTSPELITLIKTFSDAINKLTSEAVGGSLGVVKNVIKAVVSAVPFIGPLVLMAASASPAFRTGIEAIRTKQKATVKLSKQLGKIKEIVAKETGELQEKISERDAKAESVEDAAAKATVETQDEGPA